MYVNHHTNNQLKCFYQGINLALGAIHCPTVESARKLEIDHDKSPCAAIADLKKSNRPAETIKSKCNVRKKKLPVQLIGKLTKNKQKICILYAFKICRQVVPWVFCIHLFSQVLSQIDHLVCVFLAFGNLR